MLYAQQTFTHYQDIYEWDILPAGVRLKGQYTLSEIKGGLVRALSESEMGIPIEFEDDQIQFGSMLSKRVEDCIVLKNAEHPNDYFHFVFTVRTTGNMTMVEIYRSGSSPLSGQKIKQEERRGSDNLFMNILGAVTKADDRALAEEYDYYSMVADIIKEVFGLV